jgi:diguanylate cyclase (GGDEF)-like protein
MFLSEVRLLNWSVIPDVVTISLLAWAFASVARHSNTPVSAHWLTGWLLIAVHFAAFIFVPLPGIWGQIGMIVGTEALVWAGVLFMRASVPYRSETSSRAMLVVLISAYTLYVGALQSSGPHWMLNVGATLIGLGPICVSLFSTKRFNHFLRWLTVLLHTGLGAALLWAQNRPIPGDLPLSLVLFTVYFSTSIHFSYMYWRRTAGAFITITGFFLWCSEFAVAPAIETFFPSWQVDGEVWNLPQYVVAVGMILLLLEDQISERLRMLNNFQHLAHHDSLTGLANRTLFEERLNKALEASRGAQEKAALLIVDLDRFKHINDTMGHHAGDIVLREAGARFVKHVRPSDTVARTGGDEFSVILGRPTSHEDAVLVAQSLKQSLDHSIRIGDKIAQIGASIGIAVFPDDGNDIDSLCLVADSRMYDDKHGSKTRL